MKYLTKAVLKKLSKESPHQSLPLREPKEFHISSVKPEETKTFLSGGNTYLRRYVYRGYDVGIATSGPYIKGDKLYIYKRHVAFGSDHYSRDEDTPTKTIIV